MQKYLAIFALLAAHISVVSAFSRMPLTSLHEFRLNHLKLRNTRRSRQSDPEVQERLRCQALQEQWSAKFEQIKAELPKKGTHVASVVAEAAVELWKLNTKPANKNIKADNYKLLVQVPPESLQELIETIQKHKHYRHMQFAGFRPGVLCQIFNREIYAVAMPQAFHFGLKTICEQENITPVDSITGEQLPIDPELMFSLKHDFDWEELLSNFGENVTLYGAFEFAATPGFQQPEEHQPLVPEELIPPNREVDRRPKRVKRKEPLRRDL